MMSTPIPTAMSTLPETMPMKKLEVNKPTSRKSATVTFEPSPLCNVTSRVDGPVQKRTTHKPIISIAEKEELLALLQDTPQPKAPLHSSYSLLPPAYSLLLAVATGGQSERYHICCMPGEVCEHSRSCTWDSKSVQQKFSTSDRRKIYSMVYDVIALDSVLEDLLNESSFYSVTELYSCHKLVLLMTLNFIQHKFTVRPPADVDCVRELTDDEGLAENITLVAQTLWRNRLKLSSTFAKGRVECGASDLRGMLSGAKGDSYHLISTIPQHTRLLLGRGLTPKQRSKQYEDVAMALEELNFFKASTEEDIKALPPLDPHYTCSFALCSHFEDQLLSFSPGVYLEEVTLAIPSLITPQDLSSFSAIEKFRGRLEGVRKPGDIVLTHFSQGMEALHMATLLSSDEGNLLVFDVQRDQGEKFEEKLNTLNISNVTLFNYSFTEADEEELGEVRAVFCNPPCSLSAVPDPINYAMNEEEHLLPSLLSTTRGTVEAAKKLKVTSEQTNSLVHCLKVVGAALVAYFVRSHLKMETEEVVSAFVGAQEEKRIGASSTEKKISDSAKNKGKKNIFEVKESHFTSFLSDEARKGVTVEYGYFMATLENDLQQQPKSAKEARAVIDEAVASGLIKWDSDEARTPGMKAVKKRKKYKHNYLKPTASALAKSKVEGGSRDIPLSLRK